MSFYDNLKAIKEINPEVAKELEKMFKELPKKTQRNLLKWRTKQDERSPNPKAIRPTFSKSK